MHNRYLNVLRTSFLVGDVSPYAGFRNGANAADVIASTPHAGQLRPEPREFTSQFVRCESFELRRDMRGSQSRVGLHKQVHVVRHNFQPVNFGFQFLSLLVQEFPQSLCPLKQAVPCGFNLWQHTHWDCAACHLAASDRGLVAIPDFSRRAGRREPARKNIDHGLRAVRDGKFEPVAATITESLETKCDSASSECNAPICPRYGLAKGQPEPGRFTPDGQNVALLPRH